MRNIEPLTELIVQEDVTDDSPFEWRHRTRDDFGGGDSGGSQTKSLVQGRCHGRMTIMAME